MADVRAYLPLIAGTFLWLIMVAVMLGIGVRPSVAQESDHRGRITLSTGKKITYYRNFRLSRRNSDIEVAVIVVHGIQRNADEYYDWVRTTADSTSQLQRTMILAPRFPKPSRHRRPDEHVWEGGWPQGHRSVDSPRVSSFEVIDQIVDKLTRRSRFSNLRRIVLAGHSAGGQFVNRYAAAGRFVLPQDMQICFLVMNPSSYLYLDDQIDYKYGLKDPNRYVRETGQQRCRENMVTRQVFYIGGTNDVKSGYLDTSDAANAQGAHRFERFQRYRSYVHGYSDSRWRDNTTFVEANGIGHDGKKMFWSMPARRAMFGSRD